MSQSIAQPASTTTPPVPVLVPAASSPAIQPQFADSSSTVVLNNVPWEAYVAIVEHADNPGTRFTYDRGRLRIMSPSRRHEIIKSRLGRMVEIFCQESRILYSIGGSTTHKDERLKRGFEPDECYFIAHELQMRDRREWIAGVDPPPDLAIEVDITADTEEKLPVYSSFQIPELWQWHNDRIHVLQLQADGNYAEQPTSSALPEVDLRMIEDHVAIQGTSEGEVLDKFREAVRQSRK